MPVYILLIQYGDSLVNTAEENTSVLPKPSALVAARNGLQVVNICCNKIVQFLTERAS